MNEPQISTGSFLTHSAEETFELAYRIGESITVPTVMLLSGDLGAGKTVFSKGIAAGLDIDPADVNSPTFTLVNIHEGRLRLYHLDLYRLSGSADDLYSLGLDEMITDPKAVVIIEWAERLGSFSINDAYQIYLADNGNDERLITIASQAG